MVHPADTGAPPLYAATALDLACALRSGAVTSTELTAAFLARIRRLDHHTGAFVRLFERRAQRAAAAADAALASSRAVGTFHGVPTAIKDIEPVRFSRFQAGSRSLRYAWSPADGPFVRRLRRAGFVFLGATGTSEYAAMPMVETDLHPPCRNPWSLDHTSGGSSGGAAAAVAAGLLPVAHATDGGGSIRVPASHCHLVGLKPSRGGHHELIAKQDRLGMAGVNAVSLDVEDTAAVFDALNGRNYDPRRPDADSSLARCREMPRPLRIRVTTSTRVCSVEPHIASGVEHVAATLSDLGHQVTEGPALGVDVEDGLPIWYYLISSRPVISERYLQPVTRWLRSQGRRYQFDEIKERCQEITTAVERWFGDADVWLTPTVPQRPPLVGVTNGMTSEEAFRSIVPTGAFTSQFNVSGHPAISLPGGLSDDGLPFGVQLAGQHGADNHLLALARQLESALRWRDRPRPIAESPLR